MEEVTLTIKLSFSDSVQDVQALVDNVATALFYQADTSYLAPEFEDAVTEHISVTCQGKRKDIKLR